MGNRPVHRKHTIGGNQFGACPGFVGSDELSFQIVHVAVGKAKSLRFAQTNAVNDAGMIE